MFQNLTTDMKIHMRTLFRIVDSRELAKNGLALSSSKGLSSVVVSRYDFLVCALFAIILANLWIAMRFFNKL